MSNFEYTIPRTGQRVAVECDKVIFENGGALSFRRNDGFLVVGVPQGNWSAVRQVREETGLERLAREQRGG